MLDFIRIACAVPEVKVGDVKKNVADICGFIEKADAEKADVLLLPELALTGYTCGDLFFQDSLWSGVKKGLKEIADCSGKHPELTVVVGLPVRFGTRLYNCAAVISRGEVNGFVPKTHLTAAEKRWFASGAELEREWLHCSQFGLIQSQDYDGAPMDANQLFLLGDDAIQGLDAFQCAERLQEISGVPIPRQISELSTLPVRHKTVCEVADMEDTLLEQLK